MTYSSAELLVLITGIFAGFSGMAVAIITAWRTGTKVEQSAKATDAKVDTTIAEIEKVHTLTNNRATQQDKKIEELQSTIKVLIAAMAQKDQQSAILADRKVQEAAVEKGGAAERAEQQTKAIGSAVGTVVATAIEKNVEVLKKDVKEVKSDVKDVKAEVIQKKTKGG